MGNKVLLVDDDAEIRGPVSVYLKRSGYEVVEASCVRAGSDSFRRDRPDAVVLDHSLPDGTSLDLLSSFKTLRPEVPVAILTGHGSINLAVNTTKAGADDVFTKPVDLAELVGWLARALCRKAGSANSEPQPLDPFVGTSDAICALERGARLAAESHSPVLILGPTGSGKGVLARYLHAAGPRSQFPFVSLNCGALSRELLQSELFGHVKGAFTGAIRDKQGLFETADGGTLFLDEVGDLDLKVQPELLTVLEERAFRRVGGIRRRQVDIRFVSATHHDLPQRLRAREFRADLYYRASTLTLRVPSLRERREDIPDLADVLVERLSRDLNLPTAGITAATMARLVAHDWPGNIRELRNVLERGLAVAAGDPLQPSHLHFDPTARPNREPAEGSTLAELERHYVERILHEERGHVVRTAKRLGVPRSSLYAKLRVFALKPDDYR